MLITGRWTISGCALASIVLSIPAVDAQKRTGADAKADQAHVFVYRKGKTARAIKPSVYCDDKEVALMYNGHYFTLVLPPGKHTIASSKDTKTVSLDLQAGDTYYLKVGPAWSTGFRTLFGVEQVEAGKALKELGGL